jgi:hypothetical protein
MWTQFSEIQVGWIIHNIGFTMYIFVGTVIEQIRYSVNIKTRKPKTQ